MRGFLSLDPDPATLGLLIARQNLLRDALTRQGVHFTEPERLAPVLLAWPFATLDQLSEASQRLSKVPAPIRLGPLVGLPNGDRPAEIGHGVLDLEAFQSELYRAFGRLLDPDPPKPAFVRLARVSPPSRKVGAGLHGTGLLGSNEGLYVPVSLTIWKQTPTGFEPCRTMRGSHGGS